MAVECNYKVAVVIAVRSVIKEMLRRIARRMYTGRKTNKSLASWIKPSSQKSA